MSTHRNIATLAFPSDDMGEGNHVERRLLSEHCQRVASLVATHLRLRGVTITGRPHKNTDDERVLVNAIFDAACGTDDAAEAAEAVALRYP